jgi:hypothetical protein
MTRNSASELVKLASNTNTRVQPNNNYLTFWSNCPSAECRSADRRSTLFKDGNDVAEKSGFCLSHQLIRCGMIRQKNKTTFLLNFWRKKGKNDASFTTIPRNFLRLKCITWDVSYGDHIEGFLATLFCHSLTLGRVLLIKWTPGACNIKLITVVINSTT